MLLDVEKWFKNTSEHLRYSFPIIYYEVQAHRRRWRLSRKHCSKVFHMTFHENINNVRGWRLAFNVHAPQNSDYHNVKR